METKVITPEMYEALKKPLPDEAVKPHPTKTFLSSIKAIYVTERLNEVFGCGAWQLKTEHVTTGEGSMVVVKVTLEIPKYGVYYESFGGNNNGGEGSKNFDLGDAYKGATTDGITKIGSYLGIGIDVFKGKQTAPTNTEKSKTPESAKYNQDTPNYKKNAESEDDKQWLNVTDKNKDFTKRWLNVVEGIKSGKITSVAEVRKHYKVSNEVAVVINEAISNLKN